MVAPESGFSVTYTPGKSQPVTVPVQVIHNPGDFSTPASTMIDPNPVVAELQPAGPPPKGTGKGVPAPKKPKPPKASAAAPVASPFPDPAPAPAKPLARSHRIVRRRQHAYIVIPRQPSCCPVVRSAAGMLK